MAAPSAYIGRLGEFQQSRETFSAYVERLELFFAANNLAEVEVTDEDSRRRNSEMQTKMRAIFLTEVGPTVYETVKNLLAPGKPKDTSLAVILDKLKDHFDPKPLEIAESYRFGTRCQLPDEDISNFVVALKKLSIHCNFGAFQDRALRDRFVCGLRSERIRSKLMTMPNLTFDVACNTAIQMDLAEKGSKAVRLSGSSQHQTAGEVHKTYHTAKKANKPKPAAGTGNTNSNRTRKPCYRCQGQHAPEACPFREAECYACRKKGHIASACRSKGKATPKKGTCRASGSSAPGKHRQSLHTVEQEPTTEEDNLDMYTIYSNTAPSDSQRAQYGAFSVCVELGGAPVTMEIDTGASVSVIPESIYQQKLKRIPLEAKHIELRSYSGQKIPVLGTAQVPVSYKGQQAELPVVVVKGDKPALLGRNWLKSLKLNWSEIFNVRVNFKSADDVIKQHPKVFSAKGEQIEGHKAKVRVKPGATPVHCKARAVPYALKDKVEKELKRLESENIISKVESSNWATPIVVVPKSDGNVRICGDYKVTLNQVLEGNMPDTLPTAEDLFSTLTGGQVFTKMDLTNAYLQLGVDEESKSKLTINTHLGLFQFNRLPFGISTAPGIFQGVMTEILEGIEGVVCYLDDILVSAPDKTTHDERLLEVLKRLEKHNVRVKPQKCEFFRDSVEYLGHRVDKDGLHPMKCKVDAIKNAPTPKNISELRSFLGLVQYYGKFMQNLSTILHPLNELLKKDMPWRWTRECEEAFKLCKSQLADSTMLVHYDVNKPVKLQCDASPYGVGAVISHVLENGEERPIAFASRTLSASERNYAQIEREALALIFGVRRFHKYLYGRRFVIETDHKPLTAILNPTAHVPTLAAARMQRWALILSAYQYDIQYRRSAEHGNADAMSRLPQASEVTPNPEDLFYFSYVDELPVTASDIRKATQTDKVLTKVKEYVQNGWPNHMPDTELKPFFVRRNELSIDQGCVMWGSRVIIPKRYRDKLLGDLHDQHMGMCLTKSLARSYLWWPGLDKDIEHMVEQCSTCQVVGKTPPKVPLQPWKWPSRVWQRLHIDYAEIEKQNLLIVIDSHSKWVEVFPMQKTTSSKTIDVLRGLFSAYGFPEEIVSDNGPQFCSEDFTQFLKNNGVKHTRVPPYHPASNGAAERTVQIVKRALVKQMLDQNPKKRQLSLSHKLANFLITYRNTPHTTTGQTPAELFLKRKPKTRFTLLKPNLAKTVEEKQEKQKENHDRGRVKERCVEVNQKVKVKNQHQKWVKWSVGRVVRKCGPRTYMVKMFGSGKVKKVHIDHMMTLKGAELEEGWKPDESENATLTHATRDRNEIVHERTTDSQEYDVNEGSNANNNQTAGVETSETDVGQELTPTQVEYGRSATFGQGRYPVRNRKPVKLDA